MQTIKLKSIINVTQISSNNMKIWPVITHMINKYNKTEKVVIDTEGIDLEEPWKNIGFRTMLARGHIHIIVYSAEETANRIKQLFMISTGTNNTVENTGTIILEEEEVINDRSNKRTVKLFEQSLYRINDLGVINIGNKFSSLSNSDIIDDLAFVVHSIIPPKGSANEIILDFENVDVVLEEALKNLYKQLKELRARGIKVTIRNLGMDGIEKLELMESIDKGMAVELNDDEKYSILQKELQINTVGMLTTYEYTRKLDMCGRRGNGIANESVVGVFKGYERNRSNEIYLKFDMYGESEFVSKVWKIYDMGMESDEADRLNKVGTRIRIDKIGFDEFYYAPDYHFNYLLQSDGKLYDYWQLDDNGNSIKVRLTLPELVKATFDEYGVQYNRDNLNEFIQKTNIKMHK